MPGSGRKEKILIVEDNKDNINLITYFLKPNNYDISVAMDGETALQKVKAENPDIVLLDIMLPKINGFEVCEKLKKDPATRFIPVIMITALKELKDKIKSLEVGADDFITKPFESIELLARVKSLLRIKKYHDELEAKNKELKQIDQFKEELLHLIVHDMKNPIFVIQGNLQMMGMGIENSQTVLLKKYLDRIDRSTQNLLRMVMNLVDISKIETGKMKLNKEAHLVNEVIKRSVDKYEDYPEFKERTIDLELEVEIDITVFEKVLDNLLHFSLSNITTEGKVKISSQVNNKDVVLSIEDSGVAIPEKYKKSIFNKFSQVEIKNEGYRLSRGLGFTFSKLAIEAHGGSIELDSDKSQGNCFIISLPLYN